MTLPGRFVLFLSTLLLLVGGVTSGAGPASATVTTLCKGYTGCARAGMSDGGYAAASRTMWWRMYAGHNCTNYVAYRMVTSGLPNSRPWSGSGNATHWGTAMSRITNGTPTVGSVAWWRAGVRPAGRSGHVAYVEQVISPDEIIVSQDSWGGDFSWARITRTGTGWPSGFIHFNDATLVSTAPPTLTGTPRAGATLSASTGRWNLAGASFGYQWLQDGQPVAGATNDTLSLRRSHRGKAISVRVTASLPGYKSSSAVSPATAAVQRGVLSPTLAPAVSGEAVVGSTLHASPGTWDPQPDTVQHQWNADGAPLPGATGDTLVLGPDLVDRKVTVTSTAKRDGYAPVSVTSPATPPVAPGTSSLTAPLRVSGAAEPGSELAVDLTGVPAGAATTLQWLRGGQAVRGARAGIYRVSAADLGTRLSARVRVTRLGYTPLVTRSTYTPVVRVAPLVEVDTRSGPGRLTVEATVSAPGVAAEGVVGVIEVRSRGSMVAQLPVRDGVARATLTGLDVGRRGFRFRLLRTDTLISTVVTRWVTIG